jgi:hypothetical protein
MTLSTARLFKRFECSTPDLLTFGDGSPMPDLAEYMTTPEAADALAFNVKPVQKSPIRRLKPSALDALGWFQENLLLTILKKPGA